MTKKTFHALLDECAGTHFHLWIRGLGLGWGSASRPTIVLDSNGDVPSKTVDGEIIGSGRAKRCYLQSYMGSMDGKKNGDASDRADAGLKKYERWAREWGNGKDVRIIKEN